MTETLSVAAGAIEDQLKIRLMIEQIVQFLFRGIVKTEFYDAHAETKKLHSRLRNIGNYCQWPAADYMLDLLLLLIFLHIPLPPFDILSKV